MENFFEGYERTLITARLQLDKSERGVIPFTDKSKASLEVPEDFQMPDLTYVKFVLASEHENSNADYFSRSEMVKAFATPCHKPFNIEHCLEEDESYISGALFNKTQNTIIGHIVESAIARKDGSVLTQEEIEELDLEDDPSRAREEQLDVIASAVLYKFCFPKTVADIEEMIEDDDMKVSMECWFKGYDYLVGDKIVARTKATEHHDNDWHNRKVVGGRCVSRVLRGILFGGVAATEKPANKESVFLTASLNQKLQAMEERHNEIHILYDANPSEKYEQEHLQVTKNIAKLRGQINE